MDLVKILLQDYHFDKQDKALENASLYPGKIVLSADIGMTASKQFFSIKPAVFEQYYDIFKENEKHFYEVIRENHRCHLYFDLEFKRRGEGEEEKSDDELYQIFKNMVYKKCLEVYGMEPCESIELYASNKVKFSMHVIYKFKGACFLNNIQCGNFVRSLDYDGLMFGGDPIADLLVYTKNRNFRLMGSSKAREAIPRPMKSRRTLKLRETLIESQEEEGEEEILLEYFEEEGRKKKRSSSKKIGGGEEKKKKRIIQENEDGMIGAIQKELGEKWKTRIKCLEYDNDIAKFSSESKECMTYGEHNGNHVWFVVMIKERRYRQKCFSPKCFGKNSPWCLFSSELNKKVDEYFEVQKKFEETVDKAFNDYLNFSAALTKRSTAE